MRTIYVFPDYCSSGLWENGCNMDESELEGVLNTSDFMALKYWHCIWEFNVNDGTPGNDTNDLSDFFWGQWSKDGNSLVDAWNSKQDVFHFVYNGDYWK